MRYLCTFYKINLMSNLWSYLKIYHYIFEIKKHFYVQSLCPVCSLDHICMLYDSKYPEKLSKFRTLSGLGWQPALQWALSSVSVLAERILPTVRRTGLDWERSDWVTLNCYNTTFILSQFSIILFITIFLILVKQFR